MRLGFALQAKLGCLHILPSDFPSFDAGREALRNLTPGNEGNASSRLSDSRKEAGGQTDTSEWLSIKATVGPSTNVLLSFPKYILCFSNTRHEPPAVPLRSMDTTLEKNDRRELEGDLATPTKEVSAFIQPYTEEQERKGDLFVVIHAHNLLTSVIIVLRKIDFTILPVLAFTYGLQFLE